MGISASPLRYPGGKTSLFNFLGSVIEENNLEECTYVEPYAGGAGAAMKLLYSEQVSRILLNDVDRHIYEFWNVAINHTDKIIKLIEDTPVNVNEWIKQKNIYENIAKYSPLEIGFSTLFLNRCNRSGILTGGVIGGIEQIGKWKIDARFNKKNIIEKIKMLSLYRNRIDISNLDALMLIQDNMWPKKTMIYLDPPYYSKGKELYFNHYSPDDHKYLSDFLSVYNKHKWLLSYDDNEEIKKMYKDMNIIRYNITYSTHTTKEGNEIMIYDNINISEKSLSYLKSYNIL